MPERALALDLGSSSVRGIVFEHEGSGKVGPVPGAVARRLRHLDTAEPGQATFDAGSYLADLCSCLDELQAGGYLDGVTKVALDSQWHSIVMVDAGGSPVTPVLSWADTRAWRPARAGAGASLTPDQEEALRQRTGCAPSPMYWTWRVPWLRSMAGERGAGAPSPARAQAKTQAQMQTETWIRTSAPGEGRSAGSRRFVGLAELVGLALLGDAAMSVGMASGTGLLATVSRDWDPEALELAGVSLSELPALAPPDWRGSLRAEHARRWPALAEAHWYPAIGDGAAANLGVGCDGPGRAALTVGTSAAVRAVRPATAAGELPARLWRYLVDGDRVVEGAAYSSGGQLYSWALSLWEGTAPGPTGTSGGAAAAAGSVSHEVNFDLDIGVQAGSDGVLVLPWHAGTRPPARAVPAGRGAVLGLGLGHHGEHIVSAAVEAVCFQLAGGLEALEAATGRQLEVVANGGAVERGELWRRRLSATLGRSLRCPSVPETTARGAAIFAFGGTAAAALGPGDAEAVVPDERDVQVLAMARERWEHWYEALAGPVAHDGAGLGSAGPEGLTTDGRR